MLKIEYIWRELLDRVIEKNNPNFTITDLAKKFSLSTSVVNHALIPLRELNIVRVNKISSRVIDWERLLFFWATRRNVKKDITYTSFINLPVYDREAYMPSGVIPTAYTAFRLKFQKIPADYENVYFYSVDVEKIIRRFLAHQPTIKAKKSFPNIFILKPDPYLIKSKKISISQLFADLWNLPEWYAHDFQEAVLVEIRKRLKQ